MKKRGPISWKKDLEIGAPAARAPIPRRHAREEDVPEKDKHLYEESFVPGHLFSVMIDLDPQPTAPNVMPPPFPPLEQRYRYAETVPLVPAGSIAMYAGPIRVEEEGKQGRLRLIRHTFVIGTGRYMVPNLNWIKPVLLCRPNVSFHGSSWAASSCILRSLSGDSLPRVRPPKKSA